VHLRTPGTTLYITDLVFCEHVPLLPSCHSINFGCSLHVPLPVCFDSGCKLTLTLSTGICIAITHQFENMDPLGSCPRNLRHCYSCDNSLGCIIPNPPCSGKPQEWWKTIECKNCSKRWFVCMECGDCRTHIKGFDALKVHFLRYHDDRKSKRRSKRRSSGAQQKESSSTSCPAAKKKKSVTSPLQSINGSEITNDRTEAVQSIAEENNQSDYSFVQHEDIEEEPLLLPDNKAIKE
jgi:hypothetical protein